MATESWDVTDDSALRDAVRTETQYDTGKLPVDDLKGLVDSAKRNLALRADVSSFYDDRGITVALLGITCAKAKGAVENSPVVTKDLGGQNVTFRASDGTSLQLTQYEEMAQRGLANSSVTEAGPHGLEFTNTYFHG